MVMEFLACLDPEGRAAWESLDSPWAIQAFLDQTPYSAEETDRCPLRVMQDRVAHCLDGGLFAAAALRRLGYPALVVDLLPEPGADDDHVLAIYRRNGRFGAVAKSNFVGLRSREPVYRDLRELVMSYFDGYYNVNGEKTLRAYTRPLNLAAFDRYHWMVDDAGVEPIVRRMGALRPIPLVSPAMAGELSPVDRLTYDAGLMVVNWAGLYKPHNTTEPERR